MVKTKTTAVMVNMVVVSKVIVKVSDISSGKVRVNVSSKTPAI